MPYCKVTVSVEILRQCRYFSGLHDEPLAAAAACARQDRYRELATERVERRVARALLRLVAQIGRPEEDGVTVAAPLARQDLAEMTGTTLFTVSRILSAWEGQGIVSTGRERVTLRDSALLARIAEDLPEG